MPVLPIRDYIGKFKSYINKIVILKEESIITTIDRFK